MNKKRKYNFIIFDVDNTLYHPQTNLFTQIDILMQQYISNKLAISRNEALIIQHKYYHQYGATLSGLLKHHKIDAEEFSDFVHNINYKALNKQPKLANAITNLNIDKYLYTNGSRKHALNIISALGIKNTFIDIFDLKEAKYFPKPQKKSYELFFKKHQIQPHKGIFIDDMPQNLILPFKMNMLTVCPYISFKKYANYKKYIHLVTDNLYLMIKNLSQNINEYV